MIKTIEFIGSILGIITFICIAIKNREDVWEYTKNFFKFIDKLISTIDFPRRSLARKMNSPEFLAWQDWILLEIYREEHFSCLLGKQYPVFCIDFDKDYCGGESIDSICKNDNGEPLLNVEGAEVTLPDIYNTEIMTNCVAKESLEKDAELSYKKRLMGNGWWWKGYKWFTARSMRDGNHIGFILDHLELDNNNKIKKIHLSVGDYKLNLLTSHILTYELYKAYETIQRKGQSPYKIKIEALWPLLPFRHYIHHVNGDDINKVLSTGMGRYALLSVQCLVMLCTDIHNNGPEYRTFLLKRSESTRDVSTKLGCFQFPPSGGFDLYDKEDFHDRIAIQDNCSLYLALMREYFEEIFNENRYAKCEENDRVQARAGIEQIREDARAQRIEEMLTSELDELSIGQGGFKPGTKKAHFSTVGTNIDLIDLRLSVNFLLVINDLNYIREYGCYFVHNDEFGQDKSKTLKPLSVVENNLAGQRNIVEDSVALYIQGKKAFEKYINSIRAEKGK